MRKSFFMLLCFISIFISCGKDGPGDVQLSSDVLNVTGTRFSASNNSFNDTYSTFMNTLQLSDSVQVIAQIDQAANARAVGRVLNPAKVLLFSNTYLTTDLLLKNQLIALDLPQAVFFFQNDAGVVFVMYNSGPYFDSRYALNGIDNLGILNNQLQQFTKTATSAAVKSAIDLTVGLEEGIVTYKSSKTFEETVTAVKNAIAQNPDLQQIAQIDNRENAFSLGKNLRPTQTFIFSDATLETQIIQRAQTSGLEFPEKILIWEDVDGKINVSYNDPGFIKQRHNIIGSDVQLEQLSAILENISVMAIGN